MIAQEFDAERLNRWQLHGLVCVVCERMFAPDESSVAVSTVDGDRSKVRACQGCVVDVAEPARKRGRCVLWLSGQCHGDQHCRCVPMPRNGQSGGTDRGQGSTQ